MRLAKSDWDILSTQNDLDKYGKIFKKNGIKYEFSCCDAYNFLNDISTVVVDLPHFTNVKVIPFQYLALIKRAHLHRDIKWFKHIEDYVNMIRNIQIMDVNASEFYKVRRSEMDTITNVSLNMTNDEFFNKSQCSVNRRYVHDDIHAAVAIYDIPLYQSIKRDKSRAMVEYDMFCDLPFEDKCNLVREEAFVIALERYIIPDNINPNMAFLNAMRRICTTLTKGWFREFAIDYFADIINHKHDFVSKWNSALVAGKVRSL